MSISYPLSAIQEDRKDASGQLPGQQQHRHELFLALESTLPLRIEKRSIWAQMQ